MGMNISKILSEKQRLDQKKEGGGGGFYDNFVKMPEKQGAVPVRILPPSDGEEYPWVATRTHKIAERNVHCPKTLVGEGKKARWEGECPICAYYSWLWKQSERKDITDDESEAFKTKARDIKPVARYYLNCIVRELRNEAGEKELNVGPKILSVGEKMYDFIVRAITGDEKLLIEALGDVTDEKSGYDLTVVKTMSKGSDGQQYPDYRESKFAKNPSVLGTPEQIGQWMANRHDLKALRQVLPQEELKRLLKVHLGMIKDDSKESFDPSEYNLEDAPASAPVRESKPVVTSEVANSAPAELPNEVETGEADDDFINRLKKAAAAK